MDRFSEFEQIILNYQNNNNNLVEENNYSETSLRNRLETKKDKDESSPLKFKLSELLVAKEETIYNFSKSFLSECNLIVSLV